MIWNDITHDYTFNETWKQLNDDHAITMGLLNGTIIISSNP